MFQHWVAALPLFLSVSLLATGGVGQDAPFKPSPPEEVEGPKIIRPNTTVDNIWDEDFCTDKSFTIPSWIMYNLTMDNLVTWPASSAPQGDVSFVLVNRAINTWFEIECTVHGDEPCTIDGVEADDDLIIKIQVSEAETTVDITQTWTCTDKRDLFNVSVPITFKATGSMTTDIRCGYYGRKYIDEIEHVGACRGEDKLIRAELLQPFQIKPDNTGPPGLNLPSCDIMKEAPSWNLSDFSFYNSTVWSYPFWGFWLWQPSLSIGMNIENNHANFSVWCPNYYITWGDVWHIPDPVTRECSPAYYPSDHMDGAITTNVTVDLRLMTVAMEQSWYCEEEGSMNPVKIMAQGIAHLPELNCTVEDYGITTLFIPWQHDVENSYTTCSLPNNTYEVVGAATSREEIEPLTLSDRAPTTDGCTIDSMVRQNFTFSGYPYWNPGRLELVVQSMHGSRTYSSVVISLDEMGSEVDFAFVIESDLEMLSFDELEWKESRPGSFSYQETTDWRYKWDKARQIMYIHHRWICNDKESNHGIMFESWIHTQIPEHYQCELREYYQDGLRDECRWNAEWGQWTIPDLIAPGVVLNGTVLPEERSKNVPDLWASGRLESEFLPWALENEKDKTTAAGGDKSVDIEAEVETGVADVSADESVSPADIGDFIEIDSGEESLEDSTEQVDMSDPEDASADGGDD